jgi:hypothetical protein
MMKPWPDCQDTRPDDMEFCPRDGAPLQFMTLWVAFLRNRRRD